MEVLNHTEKEKPQMGYNSPREIVDVVNQTAKAKQQIPHKKTFVLALLAGAYIAMGGLLA